MRLLLLLFILTSRLSFCQAQDSWLPFTDTVTNLTGFKNQQGQVMIPPKFQLVSGIFDNIVAVVEPAESNWINYFLLKDGRQIGKDSAFYVEGDLRGGELNGKIAFLDKQKTRIGMLDHKGNVIIPAEYNYILPFKTSVTIALRDAKLQCWEKDKSLDECEHASWVGGELVLINEKNDILAKGLTVNVNNLDWHTLRTDLVNPDTNIYIAIEGINNVTYSFVDLNKEFSAWFKNIFVKSIQTGQADQDLFFPEITTWDKEWKSLPPAEFLETYPSAINPSKFDSLATRKISFHQSDLNFMIFEKPLYHKYLNEDDNQYNSKYPHFEVLISNYKRRPYPSPDFDDEFWKIFEIDYQDHYGFLRTETGYKLISAVVKH